MASRLGQPGESQPAQLSDERQTAIPGCSAVNPLENGLVLTCIAQRLDAAGLKRLRSLGRLVAQSEESTAAGAPQGCHFMASLTRRAANEAVRKARVR